MIRPSAYRFAFAMRCCQFVGLLSCLLSCYSVQAETKLFDNFVTLCEAARLAEGGDVLILKDGQYTIRQAVTFRKNEGGSEGLPIIIRSETVGGVLLKGSSIAFAFKPGASHVIVAGFKFQVTNQTAVKIEGSNHIRVTRCDFGLKETSSFDWLVITGSNSQHNRVDHCRFANKIQAGNFITIDGDTSGQQSQHDRIDHNRFLNTAPRIKNEKEAIRIGQSRLSLSNGYTLIENNYFEKCDGDPEIISIKSCKNIVRHNKIVDSVGVLSLRHGNGTNVDSNTILGKGREGCGGIRVYGDDHRIYNNYLANLTGKKFSAALAVTNGDADDAKPGKDLGKHYRPRRIQIINNSFIDNAHSIEIGYARSGKKAWKLEPQDIQFANNLIVANQFGSTKAKDLIKTYTPPTNSHWKNNLFWPNKSIQIGLVSERLKNNFVVDPQLKTAGDYRLLGADSPAIDAGIAFDFIAKDIAGTDRSSPPAIGAFEATNKTLAHEFQLD